MPVFNNELIQLSLNDGVARLTLNRADKRNALSRELIAQLSQAVEAIATDDSVRLLVLCGAGSVFCAGMDLEEMQGRAAEANAIELWQQDTQVYHNLLVKVFKLTIPTLAVVQGPALAGGLGLVLACDLVLASENAFFCLPEPKRGITAAVVMGMLIHRIGYGAATFLLLSGERISATEANRIGLCHEVLAATKLSERERELTQSILTGAPSALAMTKQFLIDSIWPVLSSQLETGMQISAKARETADAREGLAAFLEKREPNWMSNP
jgi:methylglutaconyl-CoA hydratase